jgi:hypothetical protein
MQNNIHKLSKVVITIATKCGGKNGYDVSSPSQKCCVSMRRMIVPNTTQSFLVSMASCRHLSKNSMLQQ